MQLSNLPQFTVTEIELRGAVWILSGCFNHLDGVREGRGALYLSPGKFLVGDLESLDRETHDAEFNTLDPQRPSGLPVGATHPWIDGYWEPRHIAAILDTQHEWRRVIFQAADAFERRVAGQRIVRKATGEPEGNEKLAAGQWDHEHCFLCNAHIDPGSVGYVDRNDDWLCGGCYQAYAEPHDLGFMSG